jgi:hypothetical protein
MITGELKSQIDPPARRALRLPPAPRVPGKGLIHHEGETNNLVYLLREKL